VKPQDPLVLAALGGVRLSQGDAKEAINFLEESVMRSSGEATSWYRLARAYEKVGNRERSAYCLKAFREITGLKTRLANTEEAARMHLKDPKRRLDLARVYAESGYFARAINQYQMAVSLDPSNQAIKKEMDDYTAKLKARGQMPEMSKFNGMLLASVAQEKVNRGFTKETSGAN
jgi:tetratricopeptide (TPR) repeat protein